MKKYSNTVYSVLAPRTVKGLKVDYPELRDHSEFKINRVELLFSWYHGCKISPLYDHPEVKSEREKVERCMKASGLVLNSEKRNRYLESNFDPRVSAAIAKMGSIEPSLRIAAKLDSMQKFETLQKLTSLSLDDNGNHESFKNKDGEISFTAKKQYMEMIIKFEEKKPELINQVENGFSVIGIKKGENDKNYDDNGLTYLESYFSQ